jgi:hypothetical protein
MKFSRRLGEYSWERNTLRVGRVWHSPLDYP